MTFYFLFFWGRVGVIWVSYGSFWLRLFLRTQNCQLAKIDSVWRWFYEARHSRHWSLWKWFKRDKKTVLYFIMRFTRLCGKNEPQYLMGVENFSLSPIFIEESSYLLSFLAEFSNELMQITYGSFCSVYVTGNNGMYCHLWLMCMPVGCG